MPATDSQPEHRQNEIHPIELLTQQAFEASRAGDWDRVAACYADRAIGLQTAHLDAPLVQRLMTIDAQVRSAVLVTQAAISSLLADNTQVKLKLRRLRESVGYLSPTGAVHREI